MNKNLIWILTCFCLFVSESCKEAEINNSKLRIDPSDDFMVISIQEGDDGQIFCTGIKFGTDSTLVKRYNRQLELIETINLSRRSEFQGKLWFKYIANKGWLICNRVISADKSEVMASITDDDFNILSTRTLHSQSRNSSNFSGQIFELDVLKNGDYLIAWDTSNASLQLDGFLHDDFGLRISRLNSNLESVFEYRCDNSGIDPSIEGKYNPRAIEMADGNIFFLYCLTSAKSELF